MTWSALLGRLVKELNGFSNWIEPAVSFRWIRLGAEVQREWRCEWLLSITHGLSIPWIVGNLPVNT